MRYLGSTTVARDESRFCKFEGASDTEISEANQRADLSFDREGLARRPARAEPLTRPRLEAWLAPAGALAAEQPVARVGHDDVAAAAVQQVAPRPAVEPVPAGARVELVVAIVEKETSRPSRSLLVACEHLRLDDEALAFTRAAKALCQGDLRSTFRPSSRETKSGIDYWIRGAAFMAGCPASSPLRPQRPRA